jgi:hypothetical protein
MLKNVDDWPLTFLQQGPAENWRRLIKHVPYCGWDNGENRHALRLGEERNSGCSCHENLLGGSWRAGKSDINGFRSHTPGKPSCPAFHLHRYFFERNGLDVHAPELEVIQVLKALTAG